MSLMDKKENFDLADTRPWIKHSRRKKLKTMETKFEKRIHFLFLGSFLAIVVYAVTATGIFVSLSRARTHFIESHVKKVLLIKDIEIAVESSVASARAYFLTNEEVYLQRTNHRHNAAIQLLDAIKKKSPLPEEQALIASAETAFSNYIQAINERMAAPRSDTATLNDPRVFEKDILPKRDTVNNALDAMGLYAEQEFKAAEKEARRTWRLGFVLFGSVILLSFMFFAALRWVLARLLYENRRAEEARSLSELISKQAVELTEIGIFNHNLIKDSLHLSPRMRAICGTAANTPVTMAMYLELLPAEDRPVVVAAVERTRDPNGDGIYAAEHRILRPDGTVRWVLGRGQTFFKKYKSQRIAVRTIGAVLDITDRKEIEISLRQALSDLAAQKMKLERSNYELDQFASVAAHDLRAPITSMLGWVGIIDKLTPQPRDEMVNKAIKFITMNVKKADSLISDLLQLSRINSSTIKIQDIDLNKVIKDIISVLKDPIQATQTEISADPLPKLKGCQSHLESLFTNLIRNAINYRHESRPPRIHVSSLTKPDFYEFIVKDNGIGIEPQYQQRIFEMFKTLNHTKNEFGGGTGIGLAHCKKIVELYGGKIWVESAPNEGSEFHFIYPKKLNTSQWEKTT